MIKIWHFKYAMLMTGLFFVAVGYNACSNDAAFELQDGYTSIGRFNEEDVVEDSEEQTASGPEILINGDASFTNDVNVTLTLKPNGPADEMYISNDSSCSEGQWEPVQANKLWELAKNNQKVGVYVKFRLLEGEQDSACVFDEIVHDNAPPTVQFTQGVNSLWVSDRNMAINYAVTDSGSGVKHAECDTAGNGSYKVCGQTYNLINMVENNNYSITVRATDNAGNLSEPQRLNWRPDYTAPTVSFIVKPPALSSDSTPNFQVQGVDNGSGIKGYECLLNSESNYKSCESQFTLSALAEGSHTIKVRAIDNVGHASAVITHQWQVDLTAPTVKITKWPKAFENVKTATLEFVEASGEFASFECRVDDGAYVSGCKSPYTIEVSAEGIHNFYVRGVDGANNRSAPDSRSWIVDTVAPTVKIVEAPSSPSKYSESQFGFDAKDAGSGIDKIYCGLGQTGTLSQECGSSQLINSGLTEGTNHLRVQSKDKAGNLSAIASYSWVIDRKGPTFQLISTPENPSNDVAPTFTFNVNDSGSGVNRSTVECRVDANPYQACSDSFKTPDLLDGEHSFSIRAQDLAGNLATSNPYVWSVDRTPPVIEFSLQPEALEYVGSDPKINFSVDDGLLGSGVDPSTLQCLYNSSSYVCRDGVNYTFEALEVSSHSFMVTVQDKVGNMASKTVSWNVEKQAFPVQTTLMVEGVRPVDILFVIDNSGSMDAERKELGARLQGMLDKIGGLNWQLAVTTTDVVGSSDRDEGRLLNLDGSGMRILTASQHAADPSGMQTLFENAVSPYHSRNNPNGLSNGSGDEQGIYATSLVVDRALGLRADTTSYNNAIHSAFIRENSEFSVVILSDENEASNGSSSKVVYQPQEFINRFNGQFEGNKSLTVHSIIVKSGDTACKSGSSYGTYGTLYEELSNLTGGVVGSICASSYSDQLADIGQSVVELAKSVSLECVPLDRDEDGKRDVATMYKAAGEANFVPFEEEYTVNGQKLTFTNIEALPSGDYTFDYTCNEEIPAP